MLRTLKYIRTLSDMEALPRLIVEHCVREPAPGAFALPGEVESREGIANNAASLRFGDLMDGLSVIGVPCCPTMATGWQFSGLSEEARNARDDSHLDVLPF
ncbi:hypothetical protein Snoj_04600 [Streptomyces nojiriensis]|uniref:Uncharacterized protein n=1 Tax=Streptomyces nojiriensis TaxID=66374 RepID=A0ABQ3SF27_9ACTN|nr:hypothetical protein GCM10010205_65070 [Streptomyces nojiriensis]GHI66542.1 hypothetical protein Snoj_04600 [Streptomyces nojiriensis]